MAKERGHTGAHGTPATVALARSGRPYTLHPYAHNARLTAYGDEASAALGVDPRRIFKTLVADVDGRLVVAVVPVAGRLDFKSLAHAVGGKRAGLAEAALVERSTGYVVGGISPLGQRRALPTVVDSTVRDHDTVYVSAGRRGLQVELSPDDLVLLTAATVASVARQD